jgi:hypothetical protein
MTYLFESLSQNQNGFWLFDNLLSLPKVGNIHRGEGAFQNLNFEESNFCLRLSF